MQLFRIVFITLVLTSAANASIPEDNRIAFDILRNGKPFGTHEILFSNDENGHTVVDVNISMTVDVGPITVFRYTHTNKEVWDGDTLLSITSRTNDNGKIYDLYGRTEDGVLKVQSTGGNRDLPLPYYTTSYWKMDTVKQDALLNTQKGTIENIDVKETVEDTITVNDSNITANKYLLAVEGEQDLEIWYDRNNQEWVGLDFTVRGQKLTYRRVD